MKQEVRLSKWDWVPMLVGSAIGLSLYAVAIALKGAVWVYDRTAERFAIPPL